MDKPRGILSILKPTETFPSILSPFFNEVIFLRIQDKDNLTYPKYPNVQNAITKILSEQYSPRK